MSKALTVAMRDFKHTVLTKAFLLAVVGVPILLVVVGAIAAVIMLNHKEPPLKGTIAVIDPTGEIVRAVGQAFPKPGSEEADAAEEQDRSGAADFLGSADSPEDAIATMTMGSAAGSAMPLGDIEVDINIEYITDATSEFPDAITQRIQDGDLIAAVLFDPALVDVDAIDPGSDASLPDEYELLIAPDLDSDHLDLIEGRFSEAVVRVRFDRAGRDLRETRMLLDRPRANASRLTEGGETTEESNLVRVLREIAPMIFMMLLWVATFSTGNQLLTSTIEEKSNKVMEVLLSAVSPLQLMTGKIIGQGAAGLIIVTVYSSLGIVAVIGLNQVGIVKGSDLLFLMLFFVMAYFMIASLMTAVGSAVSDIREANQLMTPVMLVIMFPLFLWMPISQAPNGLVAQITSFIPPATPFVMILRVVAEEPVPVWQIVASIVWGSICMVGMVWLASRIFRVGVLMSGKPPSPLELIRWARYR